MSGVNVSLTRQWVPMAGGSCDIRMGEDALEQGATLFSACTGSPRACLAVVHESCDADLVERLRRQLVDAGYDTSFHVVSAQNAGTLDEATDIQRALAHAGITSDDLCCAMGDADLLSAVAYACGSWCGGTSFVAVPLGEVALFEGALVPRSLDVGGRPQVVATRTGARHVLADFDLVFTDVDAETSHYARVLMVAAAVAGSERAFSELWDRADALMEGRQDVWVDQMVATAKARGQAFTSTAAAVRQSLGYGHDFAHALARVSPTPVAPSVALAEGLRFCARLSVAQDKISVDDMLAQDELLEALGIGAASCDVDSDALIKALKDERFGHTNRFMLALPLALGRVRLATIDDDLLAEHCAAWCAVHATGEGE